MSDELMVKINWLSGQWVKIESVCEKARAMVRDLERKMKQLKLYPETKDRFLELADEMTKATGEIFTCTNRFDDLEAQTIADRLEIIVIDAGSQQNERAIVAEYQQLYDNIVYLRAPGPCSVYAAWNLGIAAARGQFLTNANADDRHRADAFERMAGALAQRRR